MQVNRHGDGGAHWYLKRCKTFVRATSSSVEMGRCDRFRFKMPAPDQIGTHNRRRGNAVPKWNRFQADATEAQLRCFVGDLTTPQSRFALREQRCYRWAATGQASIVVDDR